MHARGALRRRRRADHRIGHAIPIAERQIIALREKNGELETRLRELISYGAENESIGEKLHRSTLALFAAGDLETTLGVLYHSLMLLYERLPPAYRGAVIGAVSAVHVSATPTDAQMYDRARAAVYLIAVSPKYQVEH